jgi:hypothetical protein
VKLCVPTQICTFNNLRIFRKYTNNIYLQHTPTKYTYNIYQNRQMVVLYSGCLYEDCFFLSYLQTKLRFQAYINYITCTEHIFVQCVCDDDDERSVTTDWLFVQYVVSVAFDFSSI